MDIELFLLSPLADTFALKTQVGLASFHLFLQNQKKMTRYHPLFFLHHFLAFLVCFVILMHASLAAIDKPTELVNKVCNQTSNYTFCVESLYSDSRTPDADPYTLAFVSFGLAYTNASNTKDYIAELLKNTSSRDYSRRLKICSQDFHKAVSALEEAYNDLNSETFFELAKLAGPASKASDHCQAAFNGTSSQPLASRNSDLKGLCEIGVIVGKLFTGS